MTTGERRPSAGWTAATWRRAARPNQPRSLFGEILDWMLAPLLLLWPVSAVLTWLVAQGIANRPFDRELGARVRALALEAVGESRAGARAAPARIPGFPDPSVTPGTTGLLGADEPGEFVYQVRGRRGELRLGDPALPPPPDEDPVEPGTLRFRDARLGDVPVRVAYLWVATPPDGADASAAPGGGGIAAPAAADPVDAAPLVQVAESFDRRSQLATEIVRGVLLPQFVILPLAVLLVWLALARGIAPLSDLQQRIRRRDSDDLSPLDERQAPEEVAPLVRSINDLLERLDQSMRTQRNFLADAAHQLKTPLAGLRTQAEIAERQIDAGRTDPGALKESLQRIALSSQRAADMVNQLLAMARAENRGQVAPRQRVDLARVAREAVRDFVPRAIERRIDLGYEGPDEGPDDASRLVAQPLLLQELIRNLVDNALLYTPAGGTVTVRVAASPAGEPPRLALQVEDSGPGIPPAERERVFEPFYRSLGTGVDGSGLGLAIVREIARQHGAAVAIDDAGGPPNAPGTRVTVRWPVEPASPPAV